MAKIGKCIADDILFNWPTNIRVEQLECPLCGGTLTHPNYGDIGKLPLKWYGRVVPVHGKIGVYTLQEITDKNGGNGRRRRGR
jgi:rRNA maturation protein Nop10